MKRTLITAVAVLVAGTASPAVAAPSPNPNAPAHTGTACANVFAHNPQTGSGSHASAQGRTTLLPSGRRCVAHPDAEQASPISRCRGPAAPPQGVTRACGNQAPVSRLFQ